MLGNSIKLCVVIQGIVTTQSEAIAKEVWNSQIWSQFSLKDISHISTPPTLGINYPMKIETEKPLC